MNVIILERKRKEIIVVPTSLYNKRKKTDKNIITIWQKTRIKFIDLSKLPLLKPKENKEECRFSNVEQLKKADIEKLIYDKCEELLGKR